MPSSRGSSQPRDGTCVSYASYIGSWVLYSLSRLGSPIICIDIVDSLCCTAETNKHYKAIIFQFLKREHRVEEQWLVVRGWGQEKGKVSVKGCKVSNMQNECVLGSHVQLGDCSEQYCIMYVKFAERVNPKCSQHTQKVTCEVMDRLISLIVMVT